MIRNALRQTGRTVGAVSATSRVAMVSSKILHCSYNIGLAEIRPLSERVFVYCSSFTAFSSCCRAILLTKANYLVLPRPEPQHQQPSTQHQDKLEALPTQKPRPPRSLQSSSRELGEFKRKPALPRQVGSCPLGMPEFERRYTRANHS